MASADTSPQRTLAIVFLVLGGIVASLLACAVGLGFVLYHSYFSDKAQTKWLVRELFEAIDRGDDAEYYRLNVSRELIEPDGFNQLCESVRTRLGTLRSVQQRTLSSRHDAWYYIDATHQGHFDHGVATIETRWIRYGEADEDSWYLLNLVIKSRRLAESAPRQACPRCGRNMRTNARACIHCGKLLDEKELIE